MMIITINQPRSHLVSTKNPSTINLGISKIHHPAIVRLCWDCSPYANNDIAVKSTSDKAIFNYSLINLMVVTWCWPVKSSYIHYSLISRDCIIPVIHLVIIQQCWYRCHWWLHHINCRPLFIAKSLGKLLQITHLNSSATEGDDFPIKNNDSQGSGEQWGRDEIHPEIYPDQENTKQV